MVAFNADGAGFGSVQNNSCNTGIKGFINIFLPKTLEFKCSTLGAATATGNFPQTYNNFQDNDIINAGDWGNIEYAIGTSTGTFSSSTPTSSLFYRVTNPASGNPGHYHTLSNDASVTGTNPTNKGGTNATSFPSNAGVLYASGSSAFTTLRPGNGVLIIGSSTDWATSTLTAGNNITITNGAGTITIAGEAAASMAMLGSSTLTSANSTTTVTFTAKKYLLVYAFISSTSPNNINPAFVFNGTRGISSSTVYHGRASEDLGAYVVNYNTNSLVLSNTGHPSSTMVIAEILNATGTSKMVIARTIQTAPPLSGIFIRESKFSGYFASTTQISKIELTTTNTDTFASGTSIIVFGSN